MQEDTTKQLDEAFASMNGCSGLGTLERELRPIAHLCAPLLLVLMLAAVVGGTPDAIRIRISGRQRRALLDLVGWLCAVCGEKAVGGSVVSPIASGEMSNARIHVEWHDTIRTPEPLLHLGACSDPSQVLLLQTDGVPDPAEGWLDIQLNESAEQTRQRAQMLASLRCEIEGGVDGLSHVSLPLVQRAVASALSNNKPAVIEQPIPLPEGGDLPLRITEALDVLNRLTIGAVMLTGEADGDGVLRGAPDLTGQVLSLLRRAGAVQPGLELSRGVVDFFDLFRLMIKQNAMQPLTVRQVLEKVASPEFHDVVTAQATCRKVAMLPHDMKWYDNKVRRLLEKLESYGYVQREGSRSQYTWNVPAHFFEMEISDTFDMIASSSNDAH